MEKPDLSIIMPVFNAGKYLRQAVDSVLQQESINSCYCLPSFELIVIDDASTDPVSLAVLAEVSNLDKRIRVVSNVRPKGAAGARNTGIREAAGTWIGFLDADDIWYKDSLSLRWHAICANPSINWIATKFELLKPDIFSGSDESFGGNLLDSRSLKSQEILPQASRLKRPVESFGRECLIGIMTVLIRREIVVTVGMFDETLPRSEDYHLWFKCAVQNDLFLLDIKTAFYRIHAESLTHGVAPRHLHEDKMLDMMKVDPRFYDYKKIISKRLDFVYQDQCFFYRGNKMYGKAFLSAVQWLSQSPANRSAWKEILAGILRRG